MIYVIGSGPAGVAAAKALVEKGDTVVMLDVGRELEPENNEIVEQLKCAEPECWDNDLLARLKSKSKVHSGGVENKLVFGSDYPSRAMKDFPLVVRERAKVVESFARGGLATVWGGAVLPYRDRDILDWPIGIKDLSRHYEAVLSEMGLADPGLPETFAQYDVSFKRFGMCRQIESFYRDLERNSGILNSEQIYFGFSKLAVDFGEEKNGDGCRYCGMCLYGCPYGLIYNADMTLCKLLKNERFSYQKNIFVEKLMECDGAVRIKAKSVTDSKEMEFIGRKVFLAAGFVSTTRIMLQSMEAYYRPIDIKHSDHFTFPLLRYARTRNLRKEKLLTLSQLFIGLLNNDLSPYHIHLQVYGYNDFYPKVMDGIFGKLSPFLETYIDVFLERMLIIKGYLHSNQSSHIKAWLVPGDPGGVLMLEGQPNAESKGVVKKVLKKLVSNRRSFRAVPVSFMASIGEPGEGNHSGGGFPMKKDPGEFETDIWGRLHGFRNVHIVDASIFPSIPATTITLTAMANARRIAQEC